MKSRKSDRGIRISSRRVIAEEKRDTRLGVTIQTLVGRQPQESIFSMQPTVWRLPFLLMIQMVSFNYSPDFRVNGQRQRQWNKKKYAEWFVHTGLILPSIKYRKKFKSALETEVYGTTTPTLNGEDSQYVEVISKDIINRGYMDSRCHFSRLCYRVASMVSIDEVTQEANAIFGFGGDGYIHIRNICESCRARCLDNGEKLANADKGKENGCDNEKFGRGRLRMVTAFTEERPTCDSECFRYVQPRQQYDRYDSPDGIQTPVWGPIIWVFIHIVSFALRPGNDKELSSHLRWLIETSRVLPCCYCRDNFLINLRHTVRRMGRSSSGRGGKWSHVADLIMAWQIVQLTENKDERGFKTALSLERGESVNQCHLENADKIIKVRREGGVVDISIDWYRQLYSVLQDDDMAEGGNNFARLCFEIHNTVNDMLLKKKTRLTFGDLQKQYIEFRETGGTRWYLELCLEARL